MRHEVGEGSAWRAAGEFFGEAHRLTRSLASAALASFRGALEGQRARASFTHAMAGAGLRR